jgi:hypothetical protein
MTVLNKAKINLYTGKVFPSPASATLLRAFRSANIEMSDSGPSTWSMTFQAVRTDSGTDFAILAQSQLTAYSRVILSASVGSKSYVLLDGVITSIDTHIGRGNQPDTISLKGSDLSALMDLHQKSIPWPCMPDMAIVAAILLQYSMYGIIPIVIPTMISASQGPGEVTQQQRGSDLNYIMNRTRQNGYIFKVIPGPTPGANFAYFGPPLREAQRLMAPECEPLNVSSSPLCNVEDIVFSVNAEAPTMWGGMVLDVADQDSMLVPVASLVSLLMPPFSTSPMITTNIPWVHFKLMEESNLDPIQALVMLQGRTDESAGKTVTATGSIDVERYGSMLYAPGVVSVRGAGTHHDGKYSISQLSSAITPDTFKQTFTLQREGMGSTISRVSG